MNPEEVNIKARFQIFNKGVSKPFMTVYEYNQIKASLSNSSNRLKIGDIVPTDNGPYIVNDIFLEVKEEEIPDSDFGIEMALVGTRLPYNFEICVIIEKI
jgi:hypothetical protein